MKTFVAGFCLFAALLLPAQHAASASLLFQGADLYTISDGVLTAGEMLIENGRITAIGEHLPAPANVERIDLRGKRIYPGLIVANSVIGLSEFGAVKVTQDFAEGGAINAALRVDLAVNPDTVAWPVARANGVLAALVVPQPGSGGIISGQSALMQPSGWTTEAMTIAAPVGVHVFWPNDEQLPVLERAMRDARAYVAARDAGRSSESDPQWEALRPVLLGQRPLMIHADRLHELRAILDFVDRERIRVVLMGGDEAWRIAEELRRRDIAVVLGPAFSTPSRRWEANDVTYRRAGVLANAGVRIAITNGGEYWVVTRERNLPYEAAKYAAYGLDEAAALRAITLSAAEILGVDDRLGSLQVGKVASFFVADGNILDVRSAVERAWIDGREIDLHDNRQWQLYQRYLRKYASPER
ncbi:amidohydrolase family protein [Steroidobacter sp.]|uniref:amidohydrolase family protein n=1 Tax=Steroidobacter sp. TaxID=1978227 RepID=UPI001A46429C|nr:amidohydrolase family protein [Steroidobacter sp.]MBL8271413.1 amidohydrolase family protein [Steroidobacter sp.]